MVSLATLREKQGEAKHPEAGKDAGKQAED
jgi:hypothetical protein